MAPRSEGTAQAPHAALLVLPEDRPAGGFLPLAHQLATALGGSLKVLRPVVLPEQTPIGTFDDPGHHQQASLERVLDWGKAQGIELDVSMRIGHSLASILPGAAKEAEAELVLVPALFPTEGGLADLSTLHKALSGCSQPTVIYQEPVVPREIDTVVCAVGRGGNAAAAAWFGGLLAHVTGAGLRLVHVDPKRSAQEAEDEAERWRERVEAAGWAGLDVETKVVVGEDLVDAVLNQAYAEAALVIGAPTRGRISHLFRGSRSDRLYEAAPPDWTFVVSAGGA